MRQPFVECSLGVCKVSIHDIVNKTYYWSKKESAVRWVQNGLIYYYKRVFLYCNQSRVCSCCKMKEIICCLNKFYVMTKNIQSPQKWLFDPPLSFVLAIELEQVWNSFTFTISVIFIECTWWIFAVVIVGYRF